MISSYNGTGTPPNEFLFDSVLSTGKRLRIFINQGGFTQTLSTENIPDSDSIWHQAGFVFENDGPDGLITFYFDGQQLGDSLTISNASEIPAQNFNWFLVEDANAISNLTEFFSDGDYDEAALWTRVLSPEEMNDLYIKGLGQLIPEPTTITFLAISGLALLRRRMA